MAKYRLSTESIIIREDGATIPMDERNKEYREYLAWVEKGNKPDAAEVNGKSWDQIRRERNDQLQASDWTQLSDAALTAEDKAEWREYRQALRDIPQVFEDPEDVVFPEEPV